MESLLDKINVERFWGYVDKSNKNGCWIWMKCKDSNGYGMFHVGSGNVRMIASRVAFYLGTKQLPECVCHSCDNPPCCNPSHLFAGDRASNAHDRDKKGRHYLKVNPSLSRKGEKHPKSKLTDGEVSKIRLKLSEGFSQRMIAKEFSVCQRTIGRIKLGIGWVNV